MKRSEMMVDVLRLLNLPRVSNVATVLVAAVALFGARNALAWQGAPARPVGVDDVRAEKVQLQQLVTGELRSVHRSRVASEEAGLVVKMHVVEGQAVEAGEVLAELDRRRLELALAQSNADLRVAEALVTERKADMQQAKDDAESLRTVFEQRAANAKELRDAESRLRIAEARLLGAEQAVEVTIAQRDLVEKRLSDMTVKAPFAGIVVAKHVEVGEWLGEGDPIVDVISTGTIEAWLNVPQSLYVDSQAKDASIAVNVDATNGIVRSAQKRVIPLVDAKARTFMMVVTLDNEQQAFAPGMSVTGWVPMGAAEERLTVSSNAILRNEAGPYVYVVRKQTEGPAKAMPVKVRVLFPHGSRRVIESSELQAEDLVVTEGNERLFPFAPVQPIERPVVSSHDAAQGEGE